MQSYYDVDFGGVVHEIQKTTKEAAVEWAEERLADICFRNGVRKEIMPITLIQYNGEGEEVSRLDIKIEYDYYHGDHIEHGTY